MTADPTATRGLPAPPRSSAPNSATPRKAAAATTPTIAAISVQRRVAGLSGPLGPSTDPPSIDRSVRPSSRWSPPERRSPGRSWAVCAGFPARSSGSASRWRAARARIGVVLRRPDRVPRSGRARGARRTPMSAGTSTRHPALGDRRRLGGAPDRPDRRRLDGARASTSRGSASSSSARSPSASWSSWSRSSATAAARRRHADEALALAIRRIDPTVWLVPAAPTTGTP